MAQRFARTYGEEKAAIMSDQQITCGDCGGSFVFSESERQFYETKGLSGPPKRCKSCRQARKSDGGGRNGSPRGPGSAAFGPPRGAPPRGPARGEGAPPAWGRMNGGDRPRGPGAFGPSFQSPGQGQSQGQSRGQPRDQARDQFRDQPRDGHPRDGQSRDGGFGAARGRAPRTFAARGAFTPQQPSMGRESGNGGPRPFAPPFARGPRADRPRVGGGQAQERGRTESQPYPDQARHMTQQQPPQQPARPAKVKAPRPAFDVTCVECGAAAQVPFKPIEGRDIFCQPCYRARRGLAVLPPQEETPQAVLTPDSPPPPQPVQPRQAPIVTAAAASAPDILPGAAVMNNVPAAD